MSTDLAPLSGSETTLPPDTLNARIGVLTRREVEARLLIPLIDALAAEFGRERVTAVIRDAITQIARTQGAQLATSMGGDGLAEFAESLRFWTQDDALEIDVVEQDDSTFAFNVTRCRYAELYRSLGAGDLGAVFSCNRDAALIEGFNPSVAFTRTQTIMQGAPLCDFRYQRRVQPISLATEAPDSQTPDSQTLDSQTLDSQTLDSQTLDSQAPDTQAPGEDGH